MAEDVRRITVGGDEMPMALYFSDADPVAKCYVRLLHPSEQVMRMIPPGTHPRCSWQGHGDSVKDAVGAWADHLAADHRQDWPD